MKNIQCSTLFRPQELNSREFLDAYEGNFIPLESVSLIQKHKSYEIFPWTYRSISFEFVYQISGEK